MTSKSQRKPIHERAALGIALRLRCIQIDPRLLVRMGASEHSEAPWKLYFQALAAKIYVQSKVSQVLVWFGLADDWKSLNGAGLVENSSSIPHSKRGWWNFSMRAKCTHSTSVSPDFNTSNTYEPLVPLTNKVVSIQQSSMRASCPHCLPSFSVPSTASVSSYPHYAGGFIGLTSSCTCRWICTNQST